MTSVSEEYQQIAHNCLNKVFVLKNKNAYKQIDIENIDELLTLEQIQLQKCKEKVQKRCSEYGFDNWHRHTNFTHPLGGFKHDLVSEYSTLRPNITQAYLKFAELLESYPELTSFDSNSLNQYPLRTLHLCESPGFFVLALADFLPEKLRSKWLWKMNSLCPYFEGAELDKMIIDDSFMMAHLQHLLFGPDSTGDIKGFTDDYIGNVIGETSRFTLITCDGSFDCTGNPGEQETSVFPLISQAFNVARKCLQKDGCYVTKIYTLFTEDMITYLNHFCAAFEQVFFHKPACSKPGNSEVYLVGIHYKDTDALEPISNELRFAVYEAARFFAQHQMDMMNFNLKTAGNLSASQQAAIKIMKNSMRMALKTKFKFISSAAMSEPFLYELEINNHWQAKAWKNYSYKYDTYGNYRRLLRKLGDYDENITFPIEFQPTWTLEVLNSLQLSPETLDSIFRDSSIVTLAHRSSRNNPADALLRINCSLFVDYKLLQIARNHDLNYNDMCKRNNQAFRRLRAHFALKNGALLIDAQFMSKLDWLELCYYTSLKEISPKHIFPGSHLSTILPESEEVLRVGSIQIYLNDAPTLILSRFAASVFHYLALFFDNVSLNRNCISFYGKQRQSDELANFIRYISDNIPSNCELMQFLPVKFFTNDSIYFQLFKYNNNVLHEVLARQRDTSLDMID